MKRSDDRVKSLLTNIASYVHAISIFYKTIQPYRTKNLQSNMLGKDEPTKGPPSIVHAMTFTSFPDLAYLT